MTFIATFIHHPRWFGYGWHTFLPYHLIGGTIGFLLMIKQMGRRENGKYEMLMKENMIISFLSLFIALLLGPFAPILALAVMLNHYAKYGRFTWR
jgi:hypothetical protein